MLPDQQRASVRPWVRLSQCTYRCVVLPDTVIAPEKAVKRAGLNAPTGAWCSLTLSLPQVISLVAESQCTYRCVVLPDVGIPAMAWAFLACLNAPTGAWCSLTPALGSGGMTPLRGPGAPPAPGAPLRTGQHRVQSST